MTTYRINNLNIALEEKDIFLSNGDHYLIKLSGDDKPLVESILMSVANNHTHDEMYQLVSSKYGLSKEYFEAVIEWLIQKFILQVAEAEAPVDPKRVSIAVFGNSEDKTFIMEEFLSRLNTPSLCLDMAGYIPQNTGETLNAEETEQLKNVEIVLALSPLLLNYKKLRHLNEYCIEHHVHQLHVGIGFSEFILGPLVVSELETPCLESYVVRKLANLKNLDEYTDYMNAGKKEVIHHQKISSFRYLSLLCEYLKIELSSFFLGNYSKLFGQAIIYNMLDHTVEKSRVLRIPNLSYEKQHNRSAINYSYVAG